MNEINTITTFLGWCTLINTGILIYSTIMVFLLRNFISNMHSKIFSLNPDDLPLVYFQYLGNYKIAIIILNLVPYISLKIMS